MNIELTVGGTTVRAVLDDNPTTRDLLSLLPLKPPLKDFGGSEKIAYPPRRLTTDAAPAAATGRTGDLAYYAPGATSRSSTTTAPEPTASSSSAASPRRATYRP